MAGCRGGYVVRAVRRKGIWGVMVGEGKGLGWGHISLVMIIALTFSIIACKLSCRA